MDSDSSTKFIGSLTKFLQSLCNGYVEFETGVELIGHIYLSIDSGKQFKKIDYILNEKVCKNDNSVTFISNSFHAHPLDKAKPPSGKKSSDDDGRKDDDLESGDSVPRSTNTGTVPSRNAGRSATSPSQNRVHVGSKRPGSPMKGPTPAQRRPQSPPSQRRLQHQGSKGPAGSPASTKTVPSSPSSSSQDNIPSPSARLKGRSEGASATQVSTDDAGVDPDLDGLVPSSLMPIHPSAAPDLSSFLGTSAGDDQAASQDRQMGSDDDDTKPDTDVTFIKEEFTSEPSSCAQAGGSSRRSGRSGEDQLLQDSSGLYPVMLHQNTAAFPGLPPSGFPSASSSSHPGFGPSTSSQSSSDLFTNPVPGTSQDSGGADPSVDCGKPLTDSVLALGETSLCSALQPEVFFCGECEVPFSDRNVFANHMFTQHEDVTPFKCAKCNKSFAHFTSLRRHRQGCENTFRVCCPICNRSFHRKDYLKDHLRGKCGHSSKQKFSCKICKRTFYFKSELLIHKQKCCSQKSNTV